MTDFQNKLYQTGIVPVVAIQRVEDALPLADALLTGGLSSIEVTFRSDAAASAIAAIAKNRPEMLLIAGTVLNIDTAKQAMEAGAKALVSPGGNPELIAWALDQNIPIVPGCATPTEIEAAMRLGLDFVKIFPAKNLGGPDYIRAISAPYRTMYFMPTGGVDPEAAQAYLSIPSVLCCGGSWMVTSKLLEQGRFDLVEQYARKASALVAR